MPTTSPPLLPLPTATVPFFDPNTGLISKPWYDWLIRLQAVLAKVRTEIP